MLRLGLLSVCSLSVFVLGAGCGGEPDRDTAVSTPSVASSSQNVVSKNGAEVKLVGFDASSVLIDALKEKKLQGTVVQNPFKMGYLGVKTLLDHLEKKPVEATVSTGETLVTPENLTSPDVAAVLNPPKIDPKQNATATGTKSKKWRIMVIPKGTTHEFWQTIYAGAFKAIEEAGNAEMIWQGPPKEDDRTDQIKLVQNAISIGVDGIVLAPLDSKALVAPVEQAIEKGIPVVIIDSALESKKVLSYVATNNYHGGVLAAQRMGELLKGQGRIILLRYAVGSASTEEREKGFTDTIAKEFPKISFVSDDQYAGPTSDQAQQKGQNLLTRFRGRFDGVFCPNESSALGMLRALDGAGLLVTSP